MSLTIRLSRIGRKNQPAYKLVVSNTKDKRNGKFVDIIGHFDPFKPKDKFSYDKEKFEKWKNHGVLITEAVNKLIDGKYEYVKYDPKKAKEKKEEELSTDKKQEEPVKNEGSEIKEEPKEEETKTDETEVKEEKE